MAELRYSKQAAKYLRRMQNTQAQKMRQALRNIASGSDKGLNIKWMDNRKVYRLRQGNIRAVYAFRDGGKTVLVVKIGSRGDIYK